MTAPRQSGTYDSDRVSVQHPKQRVPPGAWPGVVWLDERCTGVFVTPDRILTAAHCGIQLSNAIAFANNKLVFNMTRCDPVAGARIGEGNDLQICKTDRPAPAHWVIHTARMHDVRKTPRPTVATVVGFGVSAVGVRDAGIKREMVAPIVNWGQELRIGNREIGTCSGDSGAPAIIHLSKDHGSERLFNRVASNVAFPRSLRV